jgi:hypothetical protein
MPSLKRSSFGLAIAMALASLVVAVPVASADKPSERAEAKAEAKAEKGEAKAEKVEAKADKGEKVEKPAKEDVSGDACEAREFARVFKPWHDRRLYTLAPGGDFETLAEGWTLEGGAALAAESSPFQLGTALGASSLELPAGSTALSPPICVGRGYPSFRFVAKSVDAAALKVEILYASGKVKGRGRLKPAAEWAPTKKLSLAQGQFKVKRGKATRIQLRFAVTEGTARIDDVYVDPRFSR